MPGAEQRTVIPKQHTVTLKQRTVVLKQHTVHLKQHTVIPDLIRDPPGLVEWIPAFAGMTGPGCLARSSAPSS
ncbi:hypothetical protein [Elongatibacter sediminis]|uniref:Uncharacterized protein n=1 Tax=Elongatibacter sediminis TaxID=3119006 RepID=A0AAW9RFC4_9GAMM